MEISLAPDNRLQALKMYSLNIQALRLLVVNKETSSSRNTY